MSSLQLQGRDVHGTRDTNLASDTQAENTSKGKTSEHPSGFLPLMLPERNPLVRVKSQRREMMNMQTSKVGSLRKFGWVHKRSFQQISS